MTEKYLQGQIGAWTSNGEICIDSCGLPSANFAYNSSFFSARFARRLSVLPLSNLFRRPCLPLLFKPKRQQYKKS